jgi:rod shape determining protein RodA
MIVITLVFSGLFALTAFGHPGYLLFTALGIVTAIFAYFARDHWRLPVIAAVCISLVLGGIGSVIWNSVLSDYQRERIIAFQNPENSENTFNVEQSKIAIGSGGILGKGFANGTQSRLQFLPFHQTDFIFAAYAEEFGLVGSILLLTLFFIIFWNIFMFPIDYASYQFESIIVVAIGLKILLELFINLGTNLGISPATGIPLPLMSAGGTITIMTFFSLGLVQSIITKVKNEQMYKPKD